MSTREQRIKVFEDTMSWIKSDADLMESVSVSKKLTQVFFEDDYPTFDRPIRNEEITVTGDRSFQAAMRLYKENPGAKIAVMNFANAFHPGGGVVQGCTAQEECLCRCSTLYPLLYRRTMRDSYYKHHHDINDSKATDSLIYTEDVVICKTDEDIPQRMAKKDWVKVDVITIAAPDLREHMNQYGAIIGEDEGMNDAELFGYHVKRAIHMLTVAASSGAEILVLGAFGCGAFQNDPKVVARAYRVALEEFPKVFDKIEFAVYCGNDKTNYEVFKSVLGTHNVHNVERIKYLPGMFEPYKRETNPEHWIESGFSEMMWGLGFEMDSYESYDEKWIEKAKISDQNSMPPEEVQDYILNNLENSDVQIVGNYIFSRFRYLTHWCDYGYDSAEAEYFFPRAFDILEKKMEEYAVDKRNRQLSDTVENRWEYEIKEALGRSTIEIVKISITELDTDAIVNAANENLLEGGGVCGAIFDAAGSAELTKACRAIGECKTGEAVITPGFNLPARHIIHAVGPIWRGGNQGEHLLLKNAYRQALILAKENDCHSIAFPLISAGIYGYPKHEAWREAFRACKSFIWDNHDYKMKIVFAVIDDEIADIGKYVLKCFAHHIRRESDPKWWKVDNTTCD